MVWLISPSSHGVTSEVLCSALFSPKVFKKWHCYTRSRIQELCIMLEISLLYDRLQQCVSLSEYIVVFYCCPSWKKKTPEEYVELFAIFSLVRIIINLVTSAFFLPFLFSYSNMSSFNLDSKFSEETTMTDSYSGLRLSKQSRRNLYSNILTENATTSTDMTKLLIRNVTIFPISAILYLLYTEDHENTSSIYTTYRGTISEYFKLREEYLHYLQNQRNYS